MLMHSVHTHAHMLTYIQAHDKKPTCHMDVLEL